MIVLSGHPAGLVIGVRAQPRARRASILGEHAGAIKVAVTVPPEKGRANEAIINLLCAGLRLKKAQVSLLSGHSSRNKRFLVSGLSVAELRERLGPLTGDDVP